MLARHGGRRGLSRRLVPAVLPGFQRVRLRGTPYPTLVAAEDGLVRGALLRCGPAVLARLAAYEGPFYQLLPVRVGTARGYRWARAWAAARWRAGGSWLLG